ncbi:TauD/TfdA dioxygenase family protein [Corynebacterium terpenotabidum]|uniref:Taurine dioxygenase n=1 Tax=Corynebacterium terpenotabidum Y-11 TaxID=1200352 RepID=S4XG98_9CORY|nr:TauD/TfdA family dioxygenase [Corynebacterium terpenotabidum]AGP29683.1 taurine dioxygenase [Corynebacterium terpenotabidum Y-11]
MTSTLTRTPTVTRLGKNIGAVIDGINLSGDITDDEVEFIRTALATHKAVGFRGQFLDDDSQYAFASRIGTPTLAHPTVHSTGLDRLVIEGAANSWHTDVSFVDRVPKTSVLRAVTLPPYGGSTIFANTVAAYNALPDALRVLADNLWAVHSNEYDYAGSTAANVDYRREFTRVPFETEHPVVHVHPETGERALLLGHFVKGFLGLKSREFQDLYDIYQDRITRPDNVFRWDWQEGDVLLWDNRSTQHYGVHDFGDHVRNLHRVTLAGTVPTSVDGEQSRIITGDASEYSVIDEVRPLVDYQGDAAVL